MGLFGVFGVRSASAKISVRKVMLLLRGRMPAGVSAIGGGFPPMSSKSCSHLVNGYLEIPVLECVQEGQLDIDKFREMIPLAVCSPAKRHCHCPNLMAKTVGREGVVDCWLKYPVKMKTESPSKFSCDGGLINLIH